MNVTEFAAKMGISKTTLYRRARAAGIDLATIRDTDGNLTAEGLSLLSSVLAAGTTSTEASAERGLRADTGDQGNQADDLDDLKTQLEASQAELKAARDEIERLKSEALERERTHAEAWRRMAEQQQEIERMRLLAAGTTSTGERGGILARIRAWLIGDR